MDRHAVIEIQAHLLSGYCSSPLPLPPPPLLLPGPSGTAATGAARSSPGWLLRRRGRLGLLHGRRS